MEASPRTPSQVYWDRNLRQDQKVQILESMPPSPEQAHYLSVAERSSQSAELQARKAELHREIPDLRALGKRGDTYLVTHGDGSSGQVIDSKRNIAYPEKPMASLWRRGYWEPVHDGADVYDMMARTQWEAHSRRRSQEEIQRDTNPLARLRERLSAFNTRFGRRST